jgi:hypothetical protein
VRSPYPITDASLGKSAEPYLVELAHSPNATARYAAIVCARKIPSIDFRDELRRLAHDTARVNVFEGCTGEPHVIGREAKDSLHLLRKRRPPA